MRRRMSQQMSGPPALIARRRLGNVVQASASRAYMGRFAGGLTRIGAALATGRIDHAATVLRE